MRQWSPFKLYTYPFINLRFFCASILSENFLDDRASEEALSLFFSFFFSLSLSLFLSFSQRSGDVKGHNRASKPSEHVEIQ